jgi:hypothetical protein
MPLRAVIGAQQLRVPRGFWVRLGTGHEEPEKVTTSARPQQIKTNLRGRFFIRQGVIDHEGSE